MKSNAPSITDATLNTSADVESAFALKHTLKQSQSIAAHDRLFQQLGQHIFLRGWDQQVQQLCLDEVALFTGAKHALLMQQHAGVLKVIAQRGKGLPSQARVPIVGKLAQWLKSPIHLEVYDTYIPTFWTFKTTDNVNDLYFTHLVVAFQQEAIGMLALASANPLKAADISSLLSLCGVLGMALHSQKTSHTTADKSILKTLTPREREVFAHLPSGASNAILAQKLGIATGTVKIHIERILYKLAIKDRTQAAVKAVEMGFRSDEF